MEIKFTIPGRLAGKARIRRDGRGGAHFFKDDRTRAAENNVGWSAARAMGNRPPIEGPVSVEIDEWRAKPKSWSEKKKHAAIYVTGKPDCDNLSKLICDAMNGIVYRDDSQISDLEVHRRYSVHGEEHVNIAIKAAWRMPRP